MNRVREAISRTLTMVKDKYDTHPNLYIAGYYNGLALADHHINSRSGKPQQLDVEAFRVSSVPQMKTSSVAEPSIQEQHEYENLMDKILTAARALEMHPESNLGQAIRELDAFVSAKLEGAGQGEEVGAPDAGSELQGGSSPSPAPTLMADPL